MRTLVYKYGLLRPLSGAPDVHEQLRAAHRYRNELTAVERGRRAAVRAETSAREGLAMLEAAAEAAEAEVRSALLAISAERSEKRSRVTSPERKARLAAAKIAKREAVAALVAARKSGSVAAWEGVTTGEPDVDAYLAASAAYRACTAGPNAGERNALRETREEAAFAIADGGRRDHPVRRIAAQDAIALRAGQLRRAARAICGVPHGTYSLVEDAADQAVKSLPLYDGAEPNDPRFARFTGSGRVGIQITGSPLCATTLLGGTDSRARVERLPDPPHVTGRRKGQKALLHLRIGTKADRTPEWATWPMVMHRPIPDAARITRVVVARKINGPHEEWHACFTVDLPDVSPREGTARAVGINLGWRKIGDEIRVAKWVSDDGETGELRLPADLLGSFHYAEEVRGTRDTLFGKTLARLVAWRRENIAALPEWFTEATANAWQWRSPGRLVGLIRRWRDARFDGDADIFGSLATHNPGSPETGWLHRDRHLWQIESGVRTKAERRRRELYRVFAADMAERFGVLAVDDADYSAIARRRPVESEKADNDVARRNRFLAAVGELRQAIVQAAAAHGSRSAKVSTKDVTKTCSACGHLNSFDASEAVHFICSSCGVTHDQDENAAANILARCERGSDAPDPGPARNGENVNDSAGVKESKFARAKRKAGERRAAESTAREALRNAAE